MRPVTFCEGAHPAYICRDSQKRSHCWAPQREQMSRGEVGLAGSPLSYIINHTAPHATAQHLRTLEANDHRTETAEV